MNLMLILMLILHDDQHLHDQVFFRAEDTSDESDAYALIVHDNQHLHE